MNDCDYMSTQSSIINICVDVNNLKLREFLERLDEGSVSPNLFLKGEKDLTQIKKLAQCVFDLQCSIRSMFSGGNNEQTDSIRKK